MVAVLVVLIVWLPFRASVTGRGVYAVGSSEGAAYMSGLPIERSKLAAFTLAGLFAGIGGLYLAFQTSSGNADVPQAGAYTLNSIAAVVIGGTSLMGGSGGAIGSLIGALVLRAISFNFRIFDIQPLLQPLFEGLVLLAAVSLGAARTFRVKNRLELSGLTDDDAGAVRRQPPDRHRERVHPRHPGPGTVYTLAIQGNASFLSPTYLLQQLQVGAFLGIVAAGMMLVILLGHIDLSVPWTLAAGAMMATAVGGPLAIPVGLAVGLAVGLVNGLGVAYLRVPSMIFTLGVNAVMRGLMVAHTGGFAPQTEATPLMVFLAVGRVASIPMPLVVWAVLSLAIVLLLQRTPLGRYDLRHRQPRARRLPVGDQHPRRPGRSRSRSAAAVLGLAGVLLAGYSTKAYQGMGDAYLLPAIAAVVIGGTNILGGQGRYLGTVVGTILIMLLSSCSRSCRCPRPAGR